MKMEIDFGINRFELPPQRELEPLIYNEDEDHFFNLIKIPMDIIREDFASRAHYELPPVLGNWDLTKQWIDNMWEAMYNPIHILIFKPPRLWTWGVFDGHHRMKLLNALDASHIWAYEQHPRHLPKPNWVQKIMKTNHRAPRIGTNYGTCIHCGRETKWKGTMIGNHRLESSPLLCKQCGELNPHPYRGRL